MTDNRPETTGKVVDMASDEIQREAARINELLHTVGLTPTAVTEWWDFAAYEQLDGHTPLQAWNRGEYDTVKRLVESLVSEKFAERLAANPRVQERLLNQASEPALAAEKFREWLSSSSP